MAPRAQGPPRVRPDPSNRRRPGAARLLMSSITLHGSNLQNVIRHDCSHDERRRAAACPRSTIPGHPDSVDVTCPATMQTVERSAEEPDHPTLPDGERKVPLKLTTTGSVLDDPGQKRRHPGFSHRADGNFSGAARRLQHLAVTQVDGDMLAAARAVKDEVTTLGLRRRDVTTGVVLVTRESRQEHAHPGEAVSNQSRAI